MQFLQLRGITLPHTTHHHTTGNSISIQRTVNIQPICTFLEIKIPNGRRTFAYMRGKASSRIPFLMDTNIWKYEPEETVKRKIKDFYEKKTGENVTVRLISKEKGKGIFATRDIEPGEILWKEKPLYIWEDLPFLNTNNNNNIFYTNRSDSSVKRTLCAHCGSSTEPLFPTDTIHNHTNNNDTSNITTIFDFMDEKEKKANTYRMVFEPNIECSDCKTKYCGTQCKELDENHSLVCKLYNAISKGELESLFPENDPKAREYYPLWTFVAAFRYIGQRLLPALREELTQQSENNMIRKRVGKYWPFAMMSFVPMWDQQTKILDTDSGGVGLRWPYISEENSRTQLIKKTSTALLDKVRDLLNITATEQRILGDLWNMDGLNRFAGMLLLNSSDTIHWNSHHSALLYDEWLTTLQFRKKQKYVKEEFRKPSIPTTSDDPKTTTTNTDNNFESRAIFLVQSCVNHSCTPNVTMKEVDVFDAKKRSMAVLSTTSIKKDEEVCISYIADRLLEEGYDKHERRDTLQKRFGFECQCTRCRKDFPSYYGTSAPTH